MEISGYIKQSLMDFPDCIASVVFTQGCNFRCPYCHNQELLPCTSGVIDTNDVMLHLNRNKMLLDGVVVTGGEPTLQPNLIGFIKEVKQLGLKVKLDTNGTDPDVLQALLENSLVDYVAMDIKSELKTDCYNKTTGILIDTMMLNSIRKSIQLIKDSGIKSEFRTTICSELITPHNLSDIASYVGDNQLYYIQQYEAANKKKYTPFSESEIALVNELLCEWPNVFWR